MCFFSANSEHLGKMGKVKRGRVLQQHRHWKLFFQFPVNTYSSTHVRYCFSVILQKSTSENISLLPWTSAFTACTGVESQKYLQAFVYTRTHTIKITPSSAHTRATTVTFRANNQVSLLTRPSITRHLNLRDWTLFTCSFIEFTASSSAAQLDFAQTGRVVLQVFCHEFKCWTRTKWPAGTVRWKVKESPLFPLLAWVFIDHL